MSSRQIEYLKNELKNLKNIDDPDIRAEYRAELEAELHLARDDADL